GDAPGDLAGAAPGLRQAAGPLNHFPPLFVAELAEALAALHPLLVLVHEAVHATVQEANPLAAAVENETAADQTLLPPAGDSLGGDVEHLAELFHCMDLLASFL